MTTPTTATARRIVTIPQLVPAMPVTDREQAALDRLAATYRYHSGMVQQRRYIAPEMQAHWALQIATAQAGIRRYIAIVRRERIVANAAIMPQPVVEDGREHLDNGWSGVACGHCGTEYGACTEALLRDGRACCSYCRTNTTHDQDEPSTGR